MKTMFFLTSWLTLTALLALDLQSSNAVAQDTTAFTYQGQLHDSGTNANGSYTMSFALYDAPSDGNQIASPITTSATLANGLFSVNLDFGAGAFNGSARWLDITITSGGTTQTLSPRVQMLPSPYAIYSSTAGSAAGLTGGSWNAGFGDFPDYPDAMFFNRGGSLVFGLAANGAMVNGGLQVNGDQSISGNLAEVQDIHANGDVTAAEFRNTSDRNLKEKFTPVNNQEILERVANLPITQWNFKTDAQTRHIGPMAQDFYAAFNVGADDRHIATVDEDGVALAAIQGLNEKLKEKDARIEALETRLADLEQLVKTSTHK